MNQVPAASLLGLPEWTLNGRALLGPDGLETRGDPQISEAVLGLFGEPFTTLGTEFGEGRGPHASTFRRLGDAEPEPESHSGDRTCLIQC